MDKASKELLPKLHEIMVKHYWGEESEKRLIDSLGLLRELTDGSLFTARKMEMDTRDVLVGWGTLAPREELNLTYEEAKAEAERRNTVEGFYERNLCQQSTAFDDRWIRNLQEPFFYVEGCDFDFLTHRAGARLGLWTYGSCGEREHYEERLAEYHRYAAKDRWKAGWKEISRANVEIIRDGHASQLQEFRRRLDNYVKRYGISKIHADTYWADR